MRATQGNAIGTGRPVMKYGSGALVLLLAAIGLAGCDGAAKPEAPRTGAAMNIQEQACLAAVSKAAHHWDVVVLSHEYFEPNSLIMIGVRAIHEPWRRYDTQAAALAARDARTPWRCLVSNDGVVAEVTSTANAGGL